MTYKEKFEQVDVDAQSARLGNRALWAIAYAIMHLVESMK